ncbi:unnamed protein product (macronuclear) [Paramecium tetraurelia]|uniref:6-phosphofructo-2-kinase domain-containing protein n=1 Tax=Paramecium tetraurelia TaxID=5888 RepID=A0CH30_PARTE|nr:uncharacterized protein GSPATT00007537001 [Paramecium tetraurelia]CAK70097.1 unnamed protein product [Paramecium tetraurelia]|eukprot:XP_001437494.1 hypothetical protein (macronuclear) [Paramecium tetraurelia strain d4-2]
MQGCNRSQKIAICTVGLPARGKTYISRKLNRYFNWLGYKSRVFINGNYRREICGTECNSQFFDPHNETAQKARSDCAKMALQDLIQFLKNGGDVGILDGTNITRERRLQIESDLKQSFNGIQTLWIESICNDSKVIQNNIRLTKINNPDYCNVNSDEATIDFLNRIKMYEQIYETITDDENLSYIKTINVGADIIVHQVYGFLLSKIVSFIMNLHTYPRPIYLSRHGESQYNVDDRVGGDSDLSELGEMYADKLADFFFKEFPTKETKNEIIFFTSTMRRAIHTSDVVASKLDIQPLQLKTLDEINVGICDGMTYTEIAQKFPSDFQERKINKLGYRYPRGESYLDLISRIEPVIFEIERSRQPVMIIAHQAILRCLYAYFHQNEIPEVPTLDIPLHCVIKLTPAAYFCDEKRVLINPQTGEISIKEEYVQEFVRSKSKQKSFIDL